TAAVFHIGYSGWYKLARFMGVIQSYKVVDLETEFSNGCFVCTSNADSGFTHAPQIMGHHLPANSSVPALLRAHRNRIRQYLRKNPDVQAISIHSLQDAIESQNRQNAVQCAYRKSIDGTVLQEEMDKIAGPEMQEQGQEVVYEMQRLEDEAEGNREEHQ
ncbi:unnamed protein product, partial [marine sediment metagenome]